jgi:hypothetical protein
MHHTISACLMGPVQRLANSENEPVLGRGSLIRPETGVSNRSIDYRQLKWKKMSKIIYMQLVYLRPATSRDSPNQIILRTVKQGLRLATFEAENCTYLNELDVTNLFVLSVSQISVHQPTYNPV